MPKIVEHLESVVKSVDTPPIIMGHSAGGVFTQLLLDRGHGASAVAMNSAPTEGVLVAPWSQLHSTFPVLKNPANRHRAVGFTHEQFQYAFTNGVDEDVSRAVYERYHIPANGGILFDSVTANLKPGHQATWVDYKNDDRAPLLFISGDRDHIMPPSVQRSNAKHYKSDKTHHRDRRVRGPALHGRPRRLGEDRRPRARVGARERAAARGGLTRQPAAEARGERAARAAGEEARGGEHAVPGEDRRARRGRAGARSTPARARPSRTRRWRRRRPSRAPGRAR